MSIRTSFSIKDLENFTGIKAHTIRIWEQRYGLLMPVRSETNIRSYDLAALQKILNVALLYRNGWKISRIAELDEENLQATVKDLMDKDDSHDNWIHDLMLCTLTFDGQRFEAIYRRLKRRHGVEVTFEEVFAKFLTNIGILWTTDAITPAHEHFISTLIRQKLLVETAMKAKTAPTRKHPVYVLYLPMHEMHELGLLYIHYRLISAGCHSIYLGPDVPIDNLPDLQAIFDSITFVSYFSVQPTAEDLASYLQDISNRVLSPRSEELHVFGQKVRGIDPSSLPPPVTVHENIRSFMKIIAET